MVIFGFDLATLFKAPKVTMEPEIPDPQNPMPVEYNEIDTNAACTVKVDEPLVEPLVEPPAVPPVDNMHQKMYDMSVKTPTTTELDPVGGSENFQGGSENLG